MKNLTLLKLNFDFDTHVTNEDILKLLDASPALHTLYLGFFSLIPPVQLDVFLAARALPHLRFLGFRNSTCEPAVFAEFLRRHPQLHTLDLGSCGGAEMLPPSPAELGQEALCSLHTLAIPCDEDSDQWIICVAAARIPLKEMRVHALKDWASCCLPGVEDALVMLKHSLKRVVLMSGWNTVPDDGPTRTWLEGLLPQTEIVWL